MGEKKRKRFKRHHMDNIRVFHVIDHLGLGGAQTFLFDLVVAQQKIDRITPILCCLTESTWLSAQLEKHNILTHYLNVDRRNPIQVAAIMWRLTLLMHHSDVDIVHTHLFVSGVFGRISAFILNKPTVIHEQRNEVNAVPSWTQWIDYVLGKRTDSVICVSRSTQYYNINKKRIKNSKTCVIPNSIDTDRFKLNLTDKVKANLLSEFSIPEQFRIVIGVGRLVAQKRFDLFLRGAHFICRHEDNIVFLIVGDGPNRQALEKLSQELGIKSKVIFTGARQDVHSMLSISDVFLLTSDYEGLPLTLLEALSMGVPVIATAVDGTVEVLEGTSAGILAPPGDPLVIADAVLATLRDPLRCREMSEQGRRLVKEKYNINLISSRIERVYRSVFGS